MNRHFLLIGILSLSSLAGLFACSGAPASPVGAGSAPAPSGSRSPAPAPPGDAGPAAPGPDDAGSAPTGAGDDAGVGAPQLDAALPAATGTLLAAASGIDLVGITDDDFVAYSYGGDLRVVPVVGGAEVVVAGMPPLASAEVSGGAVFRHADVMRTGPALDVWTRATGTVLLATDSPPVGPVGATSDGTKVAFLWGVTSPQLTVRDLAGAGFDSLGAACVTALAFDADGNLVTSDCPAIVEDGGVVQDASAAPDGAIPSANLSVFAAPGYARSFLAADATYAIDPAGAMLWTVADDGTGTLVRASDGQALLTEASVSGPALFDAAGATLFYVAGEALMRVSTGSSPSPVAIVPGKVSALLAVSPDGESVVYRSGSNVFLRSSAPGATPEALAGAFAQNGKYAFTSDSKDVVFVSGPTYFVHAPGEQAPIAMGEDARAVAILAGSKLLTVSEAGEGHVIDLAGREAEVNMPQMGAFVVSKDRSSVAYVADAVTVPGLYAISVAVRADAGSGAP